jgi:glycogen debranching enzyme
MQIDDRTEWLEPDGLGGFASGTTSGVRTRRYHALLRTATTPPTGRFVLVNGFGAWVDTAAGTFALSSQRYAPDALYPNGSSHLVAFELNPWPTWHIELPDGTRALQELFVEHGTGRCFVVWTLIRAACSVALRVRPFLSGRDYHAMHHENGAFRFGASERSASVTFALYEGVPEVVASSNGGFKRSPDWYRQFPYSAEQERGLDAVEDLASPAVGGLPLMLIARERARRVVDAVERHLLTPLGLRSLPADDPAYAPRYEGGPDARDAAYHQGTVWPWLMGPFVEAWVRLRGNTPAVRKAARRRFLEPLYEHLNEAGLGHVSEIADGDAPFAPKGCPFQAWSVGELLRIDRVVLAERRQPLAAREIRQWV